MIDTVVNCKSKDILRDFAGTPASSLARRNGTKPPGLNNAIAWGSYPGASNRGAPRGARAQMQTDMASDARQHSERERF
jgi:hypothetical protein